ncbi:SurA N-terminal domain-containing protein [Falsihalocynthiibacter sp. SS001]|uniref:peptidylprolyl isomerase n=1 Tax=Falsihalocynthiibacter sp. SS001 TaxID=3349698 RepID=UPI0036D3E515
MAIGGSSGVSRFFVWVLIIGLIVGLAGFSITNFGGGATPMAKVGETEVTADEYYRALNNELNRYSQQFGQQVTLSMAAQFGIDQNLRQQLYATAATDNETANLGISVGDDFVARALQEQPTFQGLDGSFSRQDYDFYLQRNGITEAEYEETLRTEAARNIYQQSLVTGVVTPEALSDLAMEYIAGRRSFTWAVLDESNLEQEIAKPTTEQLEAYHAAHPEDFTRPEKKRITYAWVTPNDLVGTIEVPEEDLRKLYDDRADTFNVPERRMVERLAYPSVEQAEAAKARLDNDEATFGDLVQERGLTLSDIDLGEATRADLGAAADEIFALEEPAVVGPIQTETGPALFRMNAILTANVTTFEEALPELRSELLMDAASRKIGDSLNDIDDLLAGGNSLEELAAETDLELGTIDWSDDMSEGIAGYEAFREAAAAVQDGDFEKAIPLDDGGVFALRLDEVLPEQVEDLSDVRPAVSAAWRTEQVREQLMAMADEFKANLRADGTADATDVVITIETDLTRTSYVDGTPEDFMERVFALDVDEFDVIPYQDSVILVQLNGKAGPDLDNLEVVAMKEGLEQQMAQSISNDIFTSVAAKLTTDAGLTINQAVITAVHSNFPQ